MYWECDSCTEPTSDLDVDQFGPNQSNTFAGAVNAEFMASQPFKFLGL
jgi:hypothetical protein